MMTDQTASRKYTKVFNQLCREIRKTELGKNLTTKETVIFAFILIARRH
jgi:hypothetical protein